MVLFYRTPPWSGRLSFMTKSTKTGYLAMAKTMVRYYLFKIQLLTLLFLFFICPRKSRGRGGFEFVTLIS
jgi:hypothetical protein